MRITVDGKVLTPRREWDMYLLREDGSLGEGKSIQYGRLTYDIPDRLWDDAQKQGASPVPPPPG